MLRRRNNEIGISFNGNPIYVAPIGGQAPLVLNNNARIPILGSQPKRYAIAYAKGPFSLVRFFCHEMHRLPGRSADDALQMPPHYFVERFGKPVAGCSPLRYHPEKQSSSAEFRWIKILMRYRIAPSIQ